MKRTSKRMGLSRETLRILSAHELGAAAGGDTGNACGYTLACPTYAPSCRDSCRPRDCGIDSVRPCAL